MTRSGTAPRGAVPDHIRYAVRGLGLHPHHRVLEVGGGNGAAAAEILCVLGGGTGFLLGADRSAVATAAATARNATAVVHQPPSLARRPALRTALVGHLEREGWAVEVEEPSDEPPLLRVVARRPR
jgi:hypothetical protein